MMSKKKRETGAEEYVFDDDTDDSDDEHLDQFRNQIKSIASQQNGASPHDGDSSSDEESSDQESSEGDDDTDSTSEEELETDDVKAERSSNNTIINSRLEKLSSILIGEEKEESEESSDDSEQDSDQESEEEVQLAENKGYESEESNTVSEHRSSKHQGNTGKRKLVENTENVEEKKQKLESEDDERMRYRKQLSRLSVEEILQMKETLGDKIFNSRWSGNKKSKTVSKKEEYRPEFKRENKNRPRELSSKIRVPKLVKVVPVKTEPKRDPRFDPLCGEFDKTDFRKRYSFMKEVKSNELVRLKEQLQECKDHQERVKLKYLIQRAENQSRADKHTQQKEQMKSQERKENKERLERGEAPMFKSSKQKREEDLVTAYENLKKDNRVDKYIEKKNKKMNSKSRQMMEKLNR